MDFHQKTYLISFLSSMHLTALSKKEGKKNLTRSRSVLPQTKLYAVVQAAQAACSSQLCAELNCSARDFAFAVPC